MKSERPLRADKELKLELNLKLVWGVFLLAAFLLLAFSHFGNSHVQSHKAGQLTSSIEVGHAEGSPGATQNDDVQVTSD